MNKTPYLHYECVFQKGSFKHSIVIVSFEVYCSRYNYHDIISYSESQRGESHSILSHELALNYIKNPNKHRTTTKYKLKSKKAFINDVKTENVDWGISIEKEDEELPLSLNRQSTTISSSHQPQVGEQPSQYQPTNLRKKSFSFQNLPATDSPSFFNYFSSSLLRKMARSSSKYQDKAKPVEQSVSSFIISLLFKLNYNNTYIH